MARWRRTEPSRGEAFAAAGISLALGAGVAAVTYYFTRILLSREELAGSALPRSAALAALSERATGPQEATDGAGPREGEPTA